MASSICKHCGTPFTPAKNLPVDFCCNGCAYVFDLIQAEGLDRYYDLKNQPIAPVGTMPLHPRSFGWLQEERIHCEEKAAASNRKRASSTFQLQGISCVGCVWLVEKIAQRESGIVHASANPQRGELNLEWINGQFDLIAFAEMLQRHGYLIAPRSEKSKTGAKALLLRLGISGALALNATVFTLPRYLGMGTDFPLANLFSLLTLLFATLTIAIGGSYFIVRATQSLRQGILHFDFPIALGLIFAYLGSLVGWLIHEAQFLYFDFVCIFTFLMLAGRWIQERAIEQNRNRLQDKQPTPSNIARITSPQDTLPAERVAPEDLNVGDIIEIAPGELVPVSSELLNASATCSLEWITGESDPETFPVGRTVPGGATSLQNDPIRLRVSELWTDSLLARLLAASPESIRHPFLERILKWYLSCVIIFAVLGYFVWTFLLHDPLQGWQVALSILVVSCPCALGVAYPLATDLAITRLQQLGLFVRTPQLFSKLKKIRSLVFDKTGTLTLETPTLSNPEALQKLSTAQKGILLHLVRNSLHPLSRTIREHLLRQKTNDAPEAGPPLEIPGLGILLNTPQGIWSIGRSDWNGLDSQSPDSISTRLSDALFRFNGTELTAFHFIDSVRNGATQTCQQLSKQYHLFILSGDRVSKVQALGKTLGIPEINCLAQQSPEAKAQWIQSQPEDSILFLGDGANDSLAFDQAAIRGTPVVDRGLLENKSDFYFLTRGLDCLIDLLTITQLRKNALRDIFVFAVTYNILVITLAFLGMMNPLLAAILMPLSSITSIALVFLKLNSKQI